MHTSESKSFSANQNITTGFLSAPQRGKKGAYASFPESPCQLFTKDSEVTKAARREQTWGSGPTPTVLPKTHANILAFVG